MIKTVEKKFNIVSRRIVNRKAAKSRLYNLYFLIENNSINNSYIALLTRLLYNSSNKYKTLKEKSEKEDDLYGSIILFSKHSYAKNMIFSAKMLTPEFTKLKDERMKEEAIEYFLDSLLNPYVENGRFNEKLFALEKDKLLQELEIIKKDNNRYCMIRLLEESFKGNSLGMNRYGDYEIIKNIENNKLYNFYREILYKKAFYVEYSNSKNEFINNFSIDIPSNLYFKKRQKINEIIEEREINQNIYNLCLSRDIYDKNDNPAIMLFNQIFGGSSNSILFDIIREKQSLCYYINTGFDMYRSVITLTVGYDNKNHKKLLEGINYCLNKIRNDKLDDRILENAKKEIINIYMTIKESGPSYSDYIFNQDLFGINESIEEKINKINKVEIRDVKRVSNMFTAHTSFLLKGK